MDILKSGEGFINSLTSKLSTSYGDVAAEIAGNYAKSLKSNPRQQIINAAKKTNIENADKLVSRAIPETADEKFAKEMNKTMKSKISDKEKFDWIRQKQVEKHGTLAGNALFAGQVAKAYMFEDGKKAARWGTYAAGSVGLRIVSGGTLTHNNTGERDIAGIPFI